ncbi:MAG: hypothetical protein ACOYNQ_03825 [Burkholderiales bacterium]
MIVELLTPLMIATAPVMVDVKHAVYSHEAQQTVALLDGGDKDKIAYSSTRTYDWNGNPNDADWD